MKNRTLLLAWSFFVLQGCFSIFLLPLWGGFDEWLHYSYTAYLSREAKVPNQTVLSVPEEALLSVKLAPGNFNSDNNMSFSEFWDSPGIEERLQSLHSMKNSFSSKYVISSWQSQHPPLYYSVLSIFYRLMDGMPVSNSVLILRLISMLIASTALWPLFHLARLFLGEKYALPALLLFSAFPSTFVLFGHMTNDCLAFPLLSGLILFTALQMKEGSTLPLSLGSGLLLGLGLLTKLYLLTILPVILGVFGFLILKKEARARSVIHLGVFLTTAFAVSLPWFIHNIQSYGNWNPTVHAVATSNMGLGQLLSGLTLVDWKSFLVSNVIGQLWSGNWSFVSFPPPFYKIYGLLIFATIILCARRISHAGSERPLAALLGGFSLFFLLGMAQHQLQIRLAGNLDSMGGWYWAVLVPTHIFLFLWTFSPMFEKKFNVIMPALLSAVFALTLSADLGLLLPYYSGFTAVTGAFVSFPFKTALERIAHMNRLPFFLLPALLILAGSAFSAGIWTVIKDEEHVS